MGSQTTIVKIGPKRRTSGKSKKDRQHVHNVERYRKQTIRTSRNKEKAWINHLSHHPNDLQAKEQIRKVRSL